MKRFRAGRAGLIAAGLGLVVFSGAAAQGQGRPDARNLTCGQAQALVWQNGAIVLTTGRHTYDRFVSGERYCTGAYRAKRAYVETRDAASCAVGYRCVLDTERGDRWWLWR